MRDAFALSNSSHWAIAFKSALSVLRYRGIALMRSLSPNLFAAMFVLLSPVAHAAPTPAEQFVQQSLDKGYAILNDTSLSVGERGDKFRALLANTIDTKSIALFTLGIYARVTNDQELDQYKNAFSEFVTAVLQHDLAGDPGETVTVTGSVASVQDYVIVTAKLNGSTRTNGQPVNLGFRLRTHPTGAYELVDLLVEGVSMAMAQRGDFTTWLQQHHGDVAGLTNELQLRAEEFRERDMAVQAAKTALAK
jgi:phospholipid transport system substrate-binding protein